MNWKLVSFPTSMVCMIMAAVRYSNEGACVAWMAFSLAWVLVFEIECLKGRQR